MPSINFNLNDVKPLASVLGLGEAPSTADPIANGAIQTPPMQPPPPPQPTPAQAGFLPWVSDPATQKKISDGITPPGMSLLPPAPNAAPGANLMPPASAGYQVPPTAGSGAPAPAQDQAPQLYSPQMPSSVPSMPPPALPNVQQAPPTMDEDMAAHPDQYQKPGLAGQGWKGFLRYGIPAALMSAGSGLSNMGRGDPTAGFKYLGDQAALDRGVPAANAAEYDLRNVKPLRDAAGLADTQSQTAQRNALANKADTAADDMTPFTLSKEQAAAINHPELAGTQATMRDYNKALTSAGNNNTSSANNTRTNDTKEDIANTRAQVAALKPKQRDDQYIAIMSKPAAQRTPEDLAFKRGYESLINTKTTQPGVARASVQLRGPIAVADPNNPGGLVYSTRAAAIGQGAPGGIDTQVPINVAKTATSGTVGQQLLAVGTAREHMKLFGQLSDALDNGDIQAVNKISNALGIQMGSDKTTNLKIAAQAFGGEVGRAFDGAGVTAGERADAEKAYSDQLSKGQFSGAVSTVDKLLAGKQKAAKEWYDSGMQGKPNFGTPSVPRQGGAPPPPAGGKGPAENATKTNSAGDKVVFRGGKWGPA